MKKMISKTGLYLNEKLKRNCEKIPVKRRKTAVLIMCLLFLLVFALTIWDSFHKQEVQNIFQIEHITPLDIPQDSLINELKDLLHGQKQ